MNKRVIFIAFLLFFLAVAFVVYWLKIGFNIIPLRQGLYLFTSFFAAIAGMFAFYKFGFKNERALTFLCLTAGISYFFFGEVIFDYYQYILKIDPFPSVADVFYIFAYPYFLIGLINEIRISKVNWWAIHKLTLFLFVIVAILLAIIVGYFGVYQAYDSTEAFLTNFIAISYGIGDLLLIFASMMLLVLAFEFRGGRLSKVWLTLFFSFSAILIADILFAIYFKEYEALDWFYKSLLDSFWIIGYLLFTLALFEFGFSIQDIYQKIGKLKNK